MTDRNEPPAPIPPSALPADGAGTGSPSVPGAPVRRMAAKGHMSRDLRPITDGQKAWIAQVIIGTPSFMGLPPGLGKGAEGLQSANRSRRDDPEAPVVVPDMRLPAEEAAARRILSERPDLRARLGIADRAYGPSANVGGILRVACERTSDAAAAAETRAAMDGRAASLPDPSVPEEPPPAPGA